MNLTSVHDGQVAEDFSQSFADPFAAIDDAQQPAVNSKPRCSKSWSISVHSTAFSVEPSLNPSGTSVPSAVIPRLTTTVCSNLDPVHHNVPAVLVDVAPHLPAYLRAFEELRRKI